MYLFYAVPSCSLCSYRLSKSSNMMQNMLEHHFLRLAPWWLRKILFGKRGREKNWTPSGLGHTL